MRPQSLRQPREFPPIARQNLDTLQVNLGYRCNQACSHCHVNAGPTRTEAMSSETVELVIEFLRHRSIKVLDLTGGAPELNPHFRHLARAARELGTDVIDRCNLTILSEPGQEDTAGFLAREGLRVVASLPCYSQENVDRQRGKGVFTRSIEGLRTLNALGYGQPGSGLHIDLVYNPSGPVLPPAPEALTGQYREQLGEYGIVFNDLLSLTNMPIQRFRHELERDGQLEQYFDLLMDSYSAANLDHVMCRSLLSVDWQGYVYDCDFNQMLNLPMIASDKPRTHIRDLTERNLQDLGIVTADHCFGCTAGQGSSCGGALD